MHKTNNWCNKTLQLPKPSVPSYQDQKNAMAQSPPSSVVCGVIPDQQPSPRWYLDMIGYPWSRWYWSIKGIDLAWHRGRNQLNYSIDPAMTWPDDWPRWWLIDDWWKDPALDKIVCSRNTDWNLISRPQWWWLIDDRYIILADYIYRSDNLWLSEIKRWM